MGISAGESCVPGAQFMVMLRMDGCCPDPGQLAIGFLGIGGRIRELVFARTRFPLGGGSDLDDRGGPVLFLGHQKSFDCSCVVEDHGIGLAGFCTSLLFDLLSGMRIVG